MQNSIQVKSFLPTLSVRNGKAAVEFYRRAFRSIEIMKMESDDGKVVAEIQVGSCHFIVADEAPEFGNHSPEKLGGTTVRLGLEVSDPDNFVRTAVEGGATQIYPVADQSYGYRLGRIADPFGHHWEIFRKLVDGV